jgi:WD40 repeat protein
VEQKIVTGSGDGFVRVFDAVSGSLIHEIDHGDELWCCNFSPDGKFFIASSFGGWAKIYSVEDGTVMFQRSHPSWVRICVFSPDGTRFVTGCRDGKVRLFDTASCQMQKEIMVGKGLEVWCCAFSPDGNRLATSGADSKVRVYDIESEREELVLIHPGWAWTCRFFPDGRRLLTGCDDGRLRIFDTATPTATSPAKLLLTIVAAFPVPHSLSPTGYFSLPREGTLQACDVRCRNADYPLSLLNNVINRSDYVAAALRGEEVPDINEVLNSEFPEVFFPVHWPKD